MDNIETSFEKLLGRQPSEAEIAKLYRVKNALGIRDNDALWLVIMALESYDNLYSRYPERIVKQIEDAAAHQRTLIADAAELETKKALNSLTEAVAESSIKIATTSAQSVKLIAVGWVCCGLIAFGAFCTFVGFVLASGRVPYWISQRHFDNPAMLILNGIFNAPAGWLLSVISVAIAASTLVFGKKTNRVSIPSFAGAVFVLFAVLAIYFSA